MGTSWTPGKVRSFQEFREKGLLWYVNRTIFHPNGYALVFTWNDETGEVKGWDIVGNGTKIWSFDEDQDDENFAKFTSFIQNEINLVTEVSTDE